MHIDFKPLIFILVLVALAWTAFTYFADRGAGAPRTQAIGRNLPGTDRRLHPDSPPYVHRPGMHNTSGITRRIPYEPTGPIDKGTARTEADGSTRLVRLIRNRLDRPNPEERIAAIQEAYGLDYDDAVRVLREVLIRERNGVVQQEAATVLAAIAGETAVAAVTTALVDMDVAVRRQAIETLGDIASHSLHLLGQVLLGDPEPELRLLALRSLAAEGSPAALALLATAMDDADPLISQAAKEAMSASTSAHRQQLIATVDSDLLFGYTGLKDHPDNPILALTHRSNLEEKIRAIQNVQTLDEAIAVRSLQAVVEREADVSVREEALFALENMGGEAALSAITTALGDASPELRRRAMEILWSSATPEMVPLLGQVIHADPDPGLRLEAVRLLAADGGPAARALLETARHDPDERVSLTASQLSSR